MPSAPMTVKPKMARLSLDRPVLPVTPVDAAQAILGEGFNSACRSAQRAVLK
jgi:hypothetical protein